MKRLAVVFLFVIPFLHSISAQTFQAGFYIGATMTDIPGTDNIDNDADFEHLGFTIAGTVSTQISPKTKLQMEIRFFQRGAQQNPAVDTTYGVTGNIQNVQYNDYFTMTLNYVDVVIGVKRQIHFNLRHAATDRYGIEGGVSLGTLVGYSYSVQSVNYTLDLALLDISPYVGIYYNVTPHFYIEGRYSNSINSAVKADNNANNLGFYNLYYGSWDAGHNVGFSLTLGFNFGGHPAKPADNTPPPAPKDDN
jgi:hypothetical protein